MATRLESIDDLFEGGAHGRNREPQTKRKLCKDMLVEGIDDGQGYGLIRAIAREWNSKETLTHPSWKATNEPLIHLQI
jgi:hypothetical protein